MEMASEFPHVLFRGLDIGAIVSLPIIPATVAFIVLVFSSYRNQISSRQCPV
jgi:hypothetical protein